MAAGQTTILTVGHSTRKLEDFIGLLRAHGVSRLADVRTVPRSRTNPQFNRETLPQALAAAGTVYEHMPALGGLRRPSKSSVNTGWRNASFRGYADYMQTPEFAHALEELVAMAAGVQTVIMCAEAVEWRCHRSLIADALLVRGVAVEHIHDVRRSSPHRLTPFARVDGTTITYGEAA